jgi:DNA-binding transcriptional regulator of glucitol operon
LDPLFLIVALAVIWSAQSYLVYRQGKAFMRRIHVLRQEGRVAIGVGYNRIHVRTFVVVVADREDRVIRVERLTGLTIFARVRPVDRYAGLRLSEVVDVAVSQKAPRQFTTAIKQAVDALLADGTGESAGSAADAPADAPAEEEGHAPRDEEGGLAIAEVI